MADAGDRLTLAEYARRICGANLSVGEMIDRDKVLIEFLGGYVPRKLSLRERLKVIWSDRICAAWRVLTGKAWAEDYY